MFGRILRARGIIPVILILAALIYWWLRPRAPNFIAIEYVADRDAPLWNTLAQVRQRVADLHYGERLEVVRQEGTAVPQPPASGALRSVARTPPVLGVAPLGQKRSHP